MPDEVKPAESSPAPAPPTTPAEPSPASAAPAEPVRVNLSETLNTATAEERKEWETTGDDAALFDKTEKRKAEAKAASQPESAPGPQEPVKRLTPEERSERDQRRSGKRQREYFQRQIETERSQRLELERKYAEATGRKPESAPGTVQSGQPQMPDISDDKYASAGGTKLWQADMQKFMDLDFNWKMGQRDQVQEQRRTQSEAESRLHDDRSEWQQNEAAILKDFPDYPAVSKAAIQKMDQESPALADAISRLKEGPRLVVFFGKEHPEEWDRLCDLPEHEAIMELGVIRRSLKPAPQPNKDSKAPAPIHAPSGISQVVADPIQAAKDKGDWKTAERLELEKDLRDVWGVKA